MTGRKPKNFGTSVSSTILNLITPVTLMNNAEEFRKSGSERFKESSDIFAGQFMSVRLGGSLQEHLDKLKLSE